MEWQIFFFGSVVTVCFCLLFIWREPNEIVQMHGTHCSFNLSCILLLLFSFFVLLAFLCSGRMYLINSFTGAHRYTTILR